MLEQVKIRFCGDLARLITIKKYYAIRILAVPIWPENILSPISIISREIKWRALFEK